MTASDQENDAVLSSESHNGSQGISWKSQGGLTVSLPSSILVRPGVKATGHIHAIKMSHETDGQPEGAKVAGVHSSSDGQALARLPRHRPISPWGGRSHTSAQVPRLVRECVSRDLARAWTYNSSCQGNSVNRPPEVCPAGWVSSTLSANAWRPPSPSFTNCSERGWRGWSLTGGCNFDWQRSVLYAIPP